jgi:glutaconate CoA-transferase, subunit A
MERTPVLLSEGEAVSGIRDGMTIAIGGFNTASHPMALVRQIIKSGVRHLTVIGGTIAGLELDLMIGAGCVDRIVTSTVTGESLAPIGPFFRARAESGQLDVWESDEGILYAGLRAAGQGLPFLPWKAGVGSSIPEVNPEIKVFTDPIRGELLLAIPAITPEVALLHVQQSDRYGMGQHVGSGFGDRLLQRAAGRTIITVEKIVSNETIRRDPLHTSIPNADGVVYAPWGSHPFSSPGYYLVDEIHLHEYLDAAIAACRGDDRLFQKYLHRYVLEPEDHIAYLDRVGLRRLLSLREY